MPASGNIECLLTAQGHETQIATNHLGPALLALSLVPSLALVRDPRIVTTGSNIYTRLPVRFDLTDLDSERRYSRSAVYARTKTMHMTWAVEHQRRLAAAGSVVRSFVAHPGMVTTPMNTELTSRRDRILAAGLGKLWAPATLSRACVRCSTRPPRPTRHPVCSTGRMVRRVTPSSGPQPSGPGEGPEHGHPDLGRNRRDHRRTSHPVSTVRRRPSCERSNRASNKTVVSPR